MMAEQSQAVAQRDWHTWARVRILADTEVGSIDPWETRRYYAGQEVTMLQWGRKGRPVRRDSWWSNDDIDAAFILDASQVEVIEILEEMLPE